MDSNSNTDSDSLGSSSVSSMNAYDPASDSFTDNMINDVEATNASNSTTLSKSYPCKFCKVNFASSSNRSRHIKTKHPVEVLKQKEHTKMVRKTPAKAWPSLGPSASLYWALRLVETLIRPSVGHN
jgi:hypothetical protein